MQSMIARRNSRVFCELFVQKAPRGMLPVTCNALRHARIQPLFLLNINLLINPVRLKTSYTSSETFYNPEPSFACHLLISGDYQTKSGRRDIFQVCKVKYQAGCTRIKCAAPFPAAVQSGCQAICDLHSYLAASVLLTISITISSFKLQETRSTGFGVITQQAQEGTSNTSSHPATE